MPYAKIGEHNLCYETHGSGTWVVMLHHATASKRSWRHLVPRLASRFSVLTYDRPGFGCSPISPAAISSCELPPWPADYLQRDAEDLATLLDCLEIDLAALVGHSDGATIAMLAAASHPGRVDRIVAEAPHVSVDAETCPPAVANLWAEMQRCEQLQGALQRDHGHRGMAVARRWAHRWLDTAFWGWTVEDQLAHIQCPVLVIHGAQDPFFPVSHSRLVAERVPHGQLRIMYGVGHVPHLEAADLFAEYALEFLN